MPLAISIDNDFPMVSTIYSPVGRFFRVFRDRLTILQFSLEEEMIEIVLRAMVCFPTTLVSIWCRTALIFRN